ncbi:MAG: LysR family transcriptional regulator [Cupriavidus sp.]|nr:LysR family transcriptional regulator [Cupriavidus sp.]MCA3195782.1 LysR family transcriptional regulator [Cupriavidus sp.]MCA3203923.1 LysR family transcriptional regulator [Cupriavidus sp.]MCA3234112.1 LysR family transcriptional regulator [Cupriavidus sp.]MCA3774558.1 LysR family transcriptional regulator [Cutibacterium sp.]
MNQNLQQIDLNLLFVFDMLMQERNLSRAAERLHKSQPAVSNALSLRISVKVISGFGERDQGRKVVLRGQEIVA